jgi:hypothetical protein
MIRFIRAYSRICVSINQFIAMHVQQGTWSAYCDSSWRWVEVRQEPQRVFQVRHEPSLAAMLRMFMQSARRAATTRAVYHASRLQQLHTSAKSLVAVTVAEQPRGAEQETREIIALDDLLRHVRMLSWSVRKQLSY